jgi:amino acid adenylation domain-containing protein
MVTKDQPNKLTEAKELLALLLAEEGIKVPRKNVITRRKAGEPVPLSFTQQRLWFLSELEPDSAFYNIPIVIRLKGGLNAVALERALSELVRRHESLRTTFDVVDEQPVQVISPHANFSLTHVSINAQTEPEREEEVTRLIGQESNHPFNLQTGPLFRASLLRIADDEHVLVLSMHHIISDGWSAGVLFRELGALYAAYSAGQESPLEELPIQYADYAVWQREYLSGEVLGKQVSYWRKQLGGAAPVLELPTDRVRPAVQTYRGASARFEVSKGVAEGLKALSQREGVTLFMTLLAAFKVLLYRYTGQEDLSVGSPIAGRTRAEVENLIGFFINTLVLRTDMSGNPSFTQLLGRIRETTLGAYAHQDVPFEKLVEELQPERDMSRSPLFQVMFILQNAPREELVLTGLNMELVKSGTVTAKFDLSVVFYEDEQVLRGAIIYNTDLFETATINRMVDHFKVMLEAVIANPEQLVTELPILTEAERHQLLVEWNESAPLYEQNLCPHQLFEKHVELNPDGLAITFEGEQVSYRKLNAQSNRIAHGLRGMGVVEGQPVALMLGTGPRQIAALMGILKAGGTLLCLDKGYPQNRLRQILEDAEPGCVITESASLKDCEELLRQSELSSKFKLMVLDSTEDAAGRDGLDAEYYWADYIESCAETNPELLIDPASPAYLVYTSGSTGRPKGIVQSHRNFCQFLEWQSQRFEIRAPKRVAHWASISYDASYCEILGALSFGATLCQARRSTRYDPLALLEWVRKEKVSLLQMVPSFCAQVMQHLGSKPTGDDQHPLPHLESLLLVGENLPVGLASELSERFPEHPNLYNLYGPTECVLATHYAFTEVAAEQRAIPVGRNIDGRQIFILDRAGQLCPVGVRGEMYIRSPYLTQGYFKRPEETERAFVQNPLHDDYPDRVYRTGDLGRRLADGNIEFAGRVDNQVKVRGMRVELEEIEAVLSRHEAVSECAVVTHDYGQGDQRLVAYLVQRRQTEAGDAQFAKASLEGQHVSQYERVYDEVYSQGQAYADFDPTLNLRIWISSYTGQPFSKEEILEGVEDTIDRILSLKPARVLDIGCGSGLLLFKIAPHCAEYVGTDISEQALQHLRARLETDETRMPAVDLSHRGAHDFEGLEPDRFDTVIINDVHIYFPSIEYFVKVLEGAVNVTKPGGFVFVGGVRSLPLLKAFHASTQLYKASASVTREQLNRRVQQHAFADKELVIDPAFFAALKLRFPKISHVEVQLKRGRHHNEVTKFQYDVLIYVGGEVTLPLDLPTMDWQQSGLDLSSLRQLLTRNEAGALAIKDIPNARLTADVKVSELLESDAGPETAGEIREAIREQTQPAVDPEDLWTLCDELSYRVHIEGAADGKPSFNAVFYRRADASADNPAREAAPSFSQIETDATDWGKYANNPLQVQITGKLVPQLRDFLKENLPEHMVPSSFVFLDALARTPNGKVDRKALRQLNGQTADMADDYVAPQTPIETLVCEVWQTLLRVDRVGIHDNFFHLGGHSLLATQVINKLRQACSVDLPLRNFFESPTVAGLAQKIAAAQSEMKEEAERIARIVEQVKHLSDEEIETLLRE